MRIELDESVSNEYEGELVRVDQHGTWRKVPGFPASLVTVSSLGWVQTRVSESKFANPSLGSEEGGSFYLSATINGYKYKVHRLVLRAFKGPCPRGCSGDHIQRDPTGNKKLERQNNNIDNLQWATYQVQALNQSEKKPNARGKPLLVRHKDWDDNTPSMLISSSNKADKTLGTKSIAHVCNPKNPTSYAKDKHGNVWFAKHAPPLESQDDLPEDPYYRDALGNLVPQEREVWKNAMYKNGLRIPNWKLSNRGRAQGCQKGVWGHRTTPTILDGEQYARFAGGKLFHISVLISFGYNVLDGETVDHIDRNKYSNLLSNLRAADGSTQASNRNMKPTSDKCASKKNAIEAIKVKRKFGDTEDWIRFESLSEASRALGINTGGISQTLNGRATHAGGYSFRYV